MSRPANLEEVDRKVQHLSERVTRLVEAAGRSADPAQFVRELANTLDQTSSSRRSRIRGAMSRC